jgi:hypothetical protein
VWFVDGRGCFAGATARAAVGVGVRVGGRGCLGGGATGSSRCRCGSRRSAPGTPGHSAPPSRDSSSRVSSRHKVWPRPLFCFSRSTTAPPPLKARASAPLPELLLTTSDCGTKGSASAHRVGSSPTLGNARDARLRTPSTPSSQASELTPSHPLLLQRHPRCEQLPWQPRPAHPPCMPQPLQPRGCSCRREVCVHGMM